MALLPVKFLLPQILVPARKRRNPEKEETGLKKRGMILIAAMALVLLLAACGDRDNKNNGNTAGNGVTDNNGTANNGTANNNGVTNNDGTANGSGMTDSNGITGNDGRDDSLMDEITGNNGTDSSAGNNSRARQADTNSFQRMLDNARVHDTDGDLTDGENSSW